MLFRSSSLILFGRLTADFSETDNVMEIVGGRLASGDSASSRKYGKSSGHATGKSERAFYGCLQRSRAFNDTLMSSVVTVQKVLSG